MSFFRNGDYYFNYMCVNVASNHDAWSMKSDWSQKSMKYASTWWRLHVIPGIPGITGVCNERPILFRFPNRHQNSCLEVTHLHSSELVFFRVLETIREL